MTLLTALLVAPAHAVDVKFCAKYKVNYFDSDLGNGGGGDGDWFATNSDKTARGARIRTVRHSNGATQEQFAAWDGADAGCSTFTLVAGAQYDVMIVSIAQVNGNTVRVYDNDNDNDLWLSVALDNWNAPSSAATVNMTTANSHRAWHAAAAAGHALWRRNGGMTNKTYDLYTDYADGTDACNDGGGSCSAGGDVHLSDEGRNERFNIVHELGHSMQWFALGQDTIPDDNSADPANCWSLSANEFGASHEMTSKEHQSNAIQESHAHYYAAVAFNDTDESDCGFVYYKQQDYNLDHAFLEAGNTHPLSCEDGPTFTTWGIATTAFMENYCDGTWSNRGNELDWLRFFWDLDSEETSLGTTEILTVVRYAVQGLHRYPNSEWAAVPTGSTPNQDRPYIRMRDAAHTLLTNDADWDDHLDNGVAH